MTFPAPAAAALPEADDTIVALASAPGRSALAIIRLSGPRAHAIARAVVQPWPLEPGHARLCAARDADGLMLDRPVVTVYAAPRSYTGEDLVELCTHGGLVAPASIVAALVTAGARQAAPGEFTRRAVLNGKLDLAQAEAVGDLIDARSSAMQRTAMAQLDGGLSRRVSTLRDAVLQVEALVAYDIDFPEEDDGPVPRGRVTDALDQAAQQVSALLATAPAGELVRDGAVVVIAGAPNVGKSSLFNALLGRARALVSDVPGTTRDAIDATIEPAGSPFPLRLVDTAGLRESADVVERLGIEVSERFLAEAHVVLACGEAVEGLGPSGSMSVGDAVRRVRPHTSAPIIAVWTKRDTGTSDILTPAMPLSSSATRFVAPPRPVDAIPSDVPLVEVSALSGEGLRPLLAEIVSAVAARWGVPAVDAPIITRARHRVALTRAADELAQFRAAWTVGALPAVVAAVHVRAAAAALEEIIGAVGVDEVLARVFAEFCVGK